MARILVLDGHPRQGSLSAALAERYAAAARATGHDLRTLALADLPVGVTPPDHRPTGGAEPAPWVAAVQADLAWAEHLVIVAPMWWGSLPSALDALIEQVFLPGFAFRHHETDPWWDRLLTGRSARVILTMDTPPWVLRWLWRDPIGNRLRRQVLGFVGFAPIAITRFGPVRTSTPARREGWLATVESLGRRAA
ncbi:MAG: NAD(P)H-dependent oxidoreductase [Phyllobacteriaceae bacterium]|nr:NAD(P)H-dependent oxidoreductase [Phyllobacteriaceae bacterium]